MYIVILIFFFRIVHWVITSCF